MEDTTGEFGKKMNAMPKVVVTTTLTEAPWKNSTILSGDVPAGVADLKRQYGGDILVYASATLTDTLREHDLVDEYRLMVHPVVLGKGKRLFADGVDKRALELSATKTFSKGIVVLEYVPAKE